MTSNFLRHKIPDTCIYDTLDKNLSRPEILSFLSTHVFGITQPISIDDIISSICVELDVNKCYSDIITKYVALVDSDCKYNSIHSNIHIGDITFGIRCVHEFINFNKTYKICNRMWNKSVEYVQFSTGNIDDLNRSIDNKGIIWIGTDLILNNDPCYPYQKISYNGETNENYRIYLDKLPSNNADIKAITQLFS